MFLLVPAHPGCPGQIPQSRKTVVCVCVTVLLLSFTDSFFNLSKYNFGCNVYILLYAFSALTLLVGRQEGHPVVTVVKVASCKAPYNVSLILFDTTTVQKGVITALPTLLLVCNCRRFIGSFEFSDLAAF